MASLTAISNAVGYAKSFRLVTWAWPSPGARRRSEWWPNAGWMYCYVFSKFSAGMLMRAAVKIDARTVVSTIALCAILALPKASTLAQGRYFPPAGSWARKTPTEVGMDAAKLKTAIQFAQTHETNWPRDFSTQEKIFGTLLGPIPKSRAGTNGLIIRHGYVVAEFGDTNNVAPTYSVAKSMLSTVAGVAVRDGLITNLDEPVGVKVNDGGYDSRQNKRITWRNHLQQESEWEGEIWGKKHDFVGAVAFREGERKPRDLQAPGTFYEYNDVRINRLALSLLRLFKKPIPEVFRDGIMNPIGASNTWQWIPYYNAYVDIDGKKMPSISGGTRWGGGVWINAWDMARFGYLWLRGGKWRSSQSIPPEYVKAALTPAGAKNSPDYGFLWWLNAQGDNHPDLPRNVFKAQGAGSNTIFVSPDHDLVIVWRWHGEGKQQFFKQVVDSIKTDSTQ
jgi:CubicO group peptidase (beta-lactamase class C family)